MLIAAACAGTLENAPKNAAEDAATPKPTVVAETLAEPEPQADPENTVSNVTDSSDVPAAHVTSIAVTGAAGNYTFAVTISSDETGCEQYADWWEVVDAQTETLLYRRILAHSHVNEQPFTRSGGPIPIQPGQAVIVRAHMGGTQKYYGGQVLGGTVEAGFSAIADPLPSLEDVAPLPNGCAF